MQLHEVKSWGVDVGNVLIRNLPFKTRLLAEEGKLQPEDLLKQMHLMPDALLGLRTLCHRVGKENVWIISKANMLQSAVTRMMFDRYRIYPATGLQKDQVLFVTERQDKRVIIKALELEGHIDDRGEVIESIQDEIGCPVWFNPEKDDADEWIPKIKFSTRVVSGWRQLMELL